MPSACCLSRAPGGRTCPWLDELLAGWDGQLTTQMRHLVGLHIEQCQACASHRPGALRPEALFDLLPAAAPPVALRERVLRRCAEVTQDAVTRPPSCCSTSGSREWPGPQRRDRGGRNHRAATVAVAAVLSVTAAVSGALIAFGAFHPAPTLADQPRGRTSAAASPPATVRGGLPTRTRAGSSPSPKHNTNTPASPRWSPQLRRWCRRRSRPSRRRRARPSRRHRARPSRRRRSPRRRHRRRHRLAVAIRVVHVFTIPVGVSFPQLAGPCTDGSEGPPLRTRHT